MNTPLIMVVDDISSVRNIVRAMLEEIGFTNVCEASDGSDALTKLKSNSVDIVISDYMMNPKNGLDLLKEMKEDHDLKNIPFILLSAVSESKINEEALSRGATTCLSKPLAYNTLRKEIIGILASKME